MLERLVQEGADDVVLAVSQPDRPRGRGRRSEATAVKAGAEAAGIPVLQPRRLKDGKLAARLQEERVDLSVVVAYGRILPPDLFQAPPFHTLNVHASLLPRHRGAAPIQHAILSGDSETGVTLMQLSEGMDEGPMLYVKKTPIRPEDTSSTLFERLARLGSDALVEGLARAKQTGLDVVPQDEQEATYAPMLHKSDGRLDFTRPAAELDRRCRAVHPWPGATVAWTGGLLKIHRVRPVPESEMAPSDRGRPPGTVLALKPHLRIACGMGALDLIEVQPPGKRPMESPDFLRGAGRELQVGSQFSVADS